MKELICIVCPKGCHLSIDEEKGYEVSGNGCTRGIEYGKKEMTNPTRVVTSTIKILGALHSRCPVKTDGDIPKNMVIITVGLLDNVELIAPVHCGDIVIANVLETGANVVVTKDMDEYFGAIG